MTLASDPRWLAVGSSTHPDSHYAGIEAAKQAMVRGDAKLIIVFCSDRQDLAGVQAAVRSVTGGTSLIGCSTAGEISGSGVTDGGVVVAALGGAGVQVATAAVTDASTGQRRAGERLAACVDRLPPTEHRVLLMLTDGLMPGNEEVVRGAYGVLGASVPLVGGGAAVDAGSSAPSLLFDDEAHSGAAVAAALGSDAPFGIGVHHGWRKIGEPVIVTRSCASQVHVLGDEPALDAYLRRLDAPPDVWHDQAAFVEFARTRPLGLSRHNGEEMRLVTAADFAGRGMRCAAGIPQGAQVWFMAGDGDSVLDATDDACLAALRGLGGRRPLGLLAFDCAARRCVLGDAGVRREVGRLAGHAKGAPIAGLYTYGEIARTRGINGFHNETMVILAVS